VAADAGRIREDVLIYLDVKIVTRKEPT